ncbi:MAG: hypothetical protein QOI15_833 [Pseudonocardiales bacterium]|nr:hypothetical protein [Pseudonocardiales bacterium]
MNRPVLLLTVLALAAPVALATAGPASAATPKCHGFAATIKGTAGPDELNGTPGNDVIVARSGNDTVFGNGGNDIICGGGGADRLYGGSGTDYLYGGTDALVTGVNGTTRTGDTLTGGRGNDYLEPDADNRLAAHVHPDSITWNKAVTVNVPARTAVGEGNDIFTEVGAVLVGSAFGDTFIGGPSIDQIVGNGGPDFINGNAGNDQLFGDGIAASPNHDNDQILGGDGNDTIYNTFGGDIINAGPGDDKILDNAGVPDSLSGGTGDDKILAELGAGAATQTFDGGDGVDQLGLLSGVLNPTGDPATGTWDMASGDMTLTITDAYTFTAVGFETAVLSTYGATWAIEGTDGADTINVAGTNGATFDGLAGDDTFTGSLGADLFDGGADTDHAIGMSVFDTCIDVEVDDTGNCTVGP